MENLLKKGKLLDDKQLLNEAGYAFDLTKEYNKEVIKKHKIKLKEWDYYYFGNEHEAFAIVCGDLHYIGQFGLVYFNFDEKYLIDNSKLLWFTNGKKNMPTNSYESYKFTYKEKYINITVDKKTRNRHIDIYYPKFHDGKDFIANVDVIPTCKDSMVISTPFFKARHFYYNQKINNLKCLGKVMFGDTNINSKNDMVGVLDWGRGIWTYDNTWNWCSINAKSGENYLGFNLGNGFGDTSKASENMFFMNEKAYKLEQIKITYTYNKKNKIDTTGKILLENDNLHLEFMPEFTRHVDINALIIKQLTNQMFGHFNGYVIADGNKIEINNLFGFLENVHNNW